MTQNWTLSAGPTKMPLQYYKLALPIEKHHHQTYIVALLIEEMFASYLFYFSLKYSVLHHKDPTRDSQRQGVLIIHTFPAYAARLGLTATM